MTHFPFPFDRAFLWAVIGCTFAFVALPPCRRLAAALGAMDRPEQDDRRIHSHAIPRAGGIAIAVVFAAMCAIHDLWPWRDPWFLGGVAVLVGFGLIDDTRGLRPSIKFSGHILAMCCAVFGAGLSVPSIPLPFTDGAAISAPWACALISVFVGVGVINALNLIDGLDGLATGIASIAASAIAVLQAMHGDADGCLLTMSLVGCLVAVLGFNTHPARLFLGDTGSMLLGYILSCLSLQLVSSPTPQGMRPYSVFLPLLLLVVPWADSAWVMVARLSRNRDPFRGDRTHVHHQVLGLGIRHRYAVMLILGVSFAIAVLTVASSHLSDEVIVLLTICVMQAVIGGIRFAGKNLPTRRLYRQPARWTRWYERRRERAQLPARPPWISQLLTVSRLVMGAAMVALLGLFAFSGARPSGLLGWDAVGLLCALLVTLAILRSLRHHFVFFLAFSCATFLALCMFLWLSWHANGVLTYTMRMLLLGAFSSACAQLWIRQRFSDLVSTPLELFVLVLALSGIAFARHQQDFNVLGAAASCTALYVVLKAMFADSGKARATAVTACVLSLSLFIALQLASGALLYKLSEVNGH